MRVFNFGGPRGILKCRNIWGQGGIWGSQQVELKGIRPDPEVLGRGLGRRKQYDVRKTSLSPKNTDRKMNFKNTSGRREQREAGAEATDHRSGARSSALLAKRCRARGGGH